MKSTLRQSAVCLGLALFLPFSPQAADAPPAGGKSGKSAKTGAADDAAARDFFGGPIRSFRVELSPESLRSLREDARKSVPATVRVGDERYESVAVHVKGSAGSRRGIDENPALTLNFSKLNPGQLFHGLKKIHLNNSVQDASRMNELIATELYRRAGIPASRVTHGWVTINGNDQGLYVVKEGFDKLWLRRNFADPSGNLYDGGFLADVDGDLERDEGSGPLDRKDLRALAEAADTAGVAARRAALEKVLDLDQFTTFWALQDLLCDWDGYIFNHNNYRLYHEPRTGRFTFIPHGMDQMFGDLGFQLDRSASGLVARQVQEFPGFRDRLIDRVESLLTNVFTTNVVMQVFAETEARLRPAFASRPAEERERFLATFGETRSRALERIMNARQQTVSRPRPLEFDAAGVAVITGWVPRSESGRIASDAGPSPDGVQSLSMEVLKPGFTGAWRKRLRVPAGRYMWEARVRCSGVKAREDAQGSGVGLRVAGRKRANSLAGDAGWTVLSEPIESEGDRTFELLVEMRAEAGKVWIDQGSLRLRKLPAK